VDEVIIFQKPGQKVDVWNNRMEKFNDDLKDLFSKKRKRRR
jgi:hypothetical protein